MTLSCLISHGHNKGLSSVANIVESPLWRDGNEGRVTLRRSNIFYRIIIGACDGFSLIIVS